MELVKTDAKNGATTRVQRGTFRHYEIQNSFQAVSFLHILELHIWVVGLVVVGYAAYGGD